MVSLQRVLLPSLFKVGDLPRTDLRIPYPLSRWSILIANCLSQRGTANVQLTRVVWAKFERSLSAVWAKRIVRRLFSFVSFLQRRYCNLPVQCASRGRGATPSTSGETVVLGRAVPKGSRNECLFRKFHPCIITCHISHTFASPSPHLRLQKDDRVCAQLFCFDAGSGYCVAYRPAAEGSPCGDGQVWERERERKRERIWDDCYLYVRNIDSVLAPRDIMERESCESEWSRYELTRE